MLLIKWERRVWPASASMKKRIVIGKIYRAFVAAVLLVGFVVCLGSPATAENMHELFLDLHGSVRGLAWFFNGSLSRG